MILIDLIEWLWEHRGELTLSGALLFLVRRVIIHEFKTILHLGRNEELTWTRERVERLTGEQWHGPPSVSKEVQRSSKQLCSLLQRVIRPENQRRKKTMKQFLMSSNFRKWLSFLIAVIIPLINQKFSLDIDPNEVLGIIILAMAHVLGEAHIDGKKAAAAAVSATNNMLQTSTVLNSGVTIQPLQVPKLSYEEIAPYIINVHNALNTALNQVQSGKYNDSVQQAINLYMSIHTFLQKIEATPVSQSTQPEEKGA